MIRCTAMSCLLLLAGTCLAADESIYESYDGVVIGRVFLSQVERDRLDVRRSQPNAAAAVEAPSEETASVEPKRQKPAGYIIGRNGRAKIWRAGEFIHSADATSRTFPGDVFIKKHVTRHAEPDDDGTD